MIRTSPATHEVGTVSVADICADFGRILHAEFRGHPEWVASAIAPMSVESFEKYCLDPERVERIPAGVIVRAIRRVERRRGVAAAQALWDLLTRPASGLVTVPVEERGSQPRNVEHELYEAGIAYSHVMVAVTEAMADGHCDDIERRKIEERLRILKAELDDIAEVIR